MKKISDYVTESTKEIKLVVHDGKPGETYVVVRPYHRKEGDTILNSGSFLYSEIIQEKYKRDALYVGYRQMIKELQRYRDQKDGKGVRTTLLMDGKECSD